jgi:hypothetical protein
MGQTHIEADGETLELDDETTIADVKAQVGAAENDLATYADEDGSIVTMSDQDEIKNVPEDARLAFMPKDTYFGAGITR